MDERMKRDEQARNRFLLINLVRISGVAMILAGIWLARQPDETLNMAGYILLPLGLAEVFLFPTLLARAWATPKE